jgi:hypothetical protein
LDGHLNVGRDDARPVGVLFGLGGRNLLKVFADELRARVGGKDVPGKVQFFPVRIPQL